MTRFGRPHRHLRVCDSTNELARRLAEAGAPDGLIVTADSQTAGRGRQGRAWATPAGGALAYSALLRDRISPLVALATAVACCEAVESLAPVETMIKWPNDIWIEGRKVAGILVEARPQDGWAVIGIGLNLNVAPEDLPAEVAGRATSIGHGVGRDQAIVALNEALSRWIGRPAADVVEAFRRRDALAGRHIEWGDGAGTASGIDDEGNLLVRDERGGERALSAGEVHLSARLQGPTG